MAYSFFNCLFQYEMECKVIDSVNNEEICNFAAREFSENIINGGYEYGGIASYGQNYSLATNNSQVVLIKPLKHLLIVDNIIFRVLEIKKSRYTSPNRYKKNISNFEYVIVLE